MTDVKPAGMGVGYPDLHTVHMDEIMRIMKKTHRILRYGSKRQKVNAKRAFNLFPYQQAALNLLKLLK